jgi:hypothetical protein
MQKFDKPALRRKAATYFNSNPEAKQFFATEDGMFFTNQSLARDHNRSQVKGELHTITRNAVIAQEVIDEKPKKADKSDASGEPSKNQAEQGTAAASSSEADDSKETPAPEGEGTQEPAAEFTQLDLEQLQEEYERVTGNKPGNRKAETLQKEIEEALKEAK